MMSLPALAVAVVAVLLALPTAAPAWGGLSYGSYGGPYHSGYGSAASGSAAYGTAAYGGNQSNQFGPNYMPRYTWSSSGAPRYLGFGSAYGTRYGTYPGDYHYGGVPGSTYSPGVYRAW
jgi:hypothetical protein